MRGGGYFKTFKEGQKRPENRPIMGELNGNKDAVSLPPIGAAKLQDTPTAHAAASSSLL